MSSVAYIHEKTYVAVHCLASGAGTFEERLWNAFVSALMRLESKDAVANIAEDLNWVLLKCEHHHVQGEQRMTAIDELDRNKIVEKLLHILIETTVMVRSP